MSSSTRLAIMTLCDAQRVVPLRALKRKSGRLLDYTNSEALQFLVYHVLMYVDQY